MTARVRCSLFCVCLVFSSEAGLRAQVYDIRPLTEQDIQKTYTQMLRDAYQYAGRDWKAASFDTAAGYWGDGVSRGNEGIRTIGDMLLACATLLKYDGSLTADERRELLAKATASLRYMTATHVTGTQKCADGKPWGATEKFGGESWQSGMWTGNLAFGAWLIWDQLDAALWQDIQRVIAWEVDILSQREPPTALLVDTKAEENAWEIPALVLGELMFPGHPHAALWHETALKYMMNTLSTEADLRDTRLVDGRAVNQWVRGANLLPDFTLENHRMFHPSYVACSSYFLTQAALYYTYAGRPVPQAATHHLLDTWRMFRTVLLPWGAAAYPQGMDWELHGLPYINLFAALGTRQKDAFAARMEQSSLQYMRAWQQMFQGNLTPPGSRFGIARHAINAEQIAYAFVAHKVFGPPAKGLTARETAAQERGVWEYRPLDFIVHRTQEKFFSFSWKNKIMGQLIPIGEGREGNPNFTVPIATGFTGSFELEPRGDDKTTVVEHSWLRKPDGVETSGTLLRNDGRLKQVLRITSAGDRIVIYEDRVTALADVTVHSERGVPLGIENDAISGGTRVVSDQDGQTKFDWNQPQQPAVLHGKWANIDGRLGIVKVAGADLAYVQSSTYSAGIAVRADILYGSYSGQPRQFKAGAEVAHRVIVAAVEATPEETAALARSCRTEAKTGGQVLRCKQTAVPLLAAH